MIKFYFLVLVILSLTSCKSEKEQSQIIHPKENSTTPEEDQKRLQDKLAPTEKVWDSLSTILRRKDLEEDYRDSVHKEYLKNRYKQEEVYKDFIRENPDSEVSVQNLNGFKFTWGKEATDELYRPLSADMKNTKEGKLIQKYLSYFNQPEVNDHYIDFTLDNVLGEKVQLSENLDNYTLLEFWASWCTGCRKKHPDLINIYEDYKEKGFTIIGVSADENEAVWREAVNKDELPWTNLIMPEGREDIVHLQYGIRKVPTNFLINQNGKIVAIDIKVDQLEKLLKYSLPAAQSNL